MKEGSCRKGTCVHVKNALKRKRMKSKAVLVDIQGGAVQYTSVPRGIRLVIRDFDNCSMCGGEYCENGYVQPCPKEARR